LLTLRFYVPEREYQGDGRRRFGPELAERIAAVPGVDSAAVTFIDPFVWGGFQRGFTVEGHSPISNAEADTIYYQEAGPNYFRTMGVPVRGREFTMRDSLQAPRVVMVSESFARRYWPGQNPISKRIKYGALESSQPWMEVIGVAGDIKYSSVRQDPKTAPVLYGPLLQSQEIANMSLIVRTRAAPGTMMGALREAIERVDSTIPVYSMATFSQRMWADSAETRSYASLLGLFALIAAVLAAVGIYGVISYLVTQRTREMGIRMALGATPAGVLRQVLREGLWLGIVGVLAGVAGALALMRVMTGLLFEVSPFDPMVFLAATCALVAIVLAACCVPARRAMRVDPMVALRYE
jgi:predicted permease